MTNKEFRLVFMGGLQLRLGDDDITGQLSAKSQALLCYLCMTGEPHSRQVLSGLLWGEKPEEAARRSLRVDLTQMRQVIEPYLVITRQTLAFNRHSPYWLDVEAFEHYIRRGRQPDGTVNTAMLREAVTLYRGSFLSGFDLLDARPFEEWMRAQRERLHQMALSALDILVEECIEQEAYVTGIEYANQLLMLDGWRETAHRQLMWLLARSGQRSAALVQYETCRTILQEELGIEPMAETTALYHEIRQLQATAIRQAKPLPPLPEEDALEPTPFQVPVPIPHFWGRDQELSRLRRLLTDSSLPAVYALTGMGGIGKTALAIHLAHLLHDDFTDGVLWTNAATSEPMTVAERWAAAYGYDYNGLPDLESRIAALHSILSQKQALLILDDAVSAARIRPLLPAEGNCKVLITTRNLELAYALGAEPLHLTELTPASARELLVRVIGEERLREEEEAAAEICRRLQNLPLAVTIAARYLASRPRRKLAALAAQLHDESRRLDLRLGDREVRASFAVSWRGLDETQRRIFSLLAVFEGRAFTPEALAAVAKMNLYEAQDRLDDLVMLSLLNEEGERHYRQHSLLADFAREHLKSRQAPYRRMVAYYLAYATNYSRDYEALRPEWENLSAGIRLAYQLQMWSSVIDYTRVLQEAWFARGRFTEAREAYRWAQQAAMALEDEQIMADCLTVWGRACIEQNAYDEARDLLRRSQDLQQQLGNPAGVATAQYHLARIAIEQADYQEAERLLMESRRLREALEDDFGIGETLYRLAVLRYQRGNYQEAEELLQQALALQEQVDDRLGSIRTLRILALLVLRLRRQDFDQAERYCRRALALCDELQDQGELAMTLLEFSSVHRAKGELALAREQAEKGLALLKKIGDRRMQALALFRLSQINQDMGAFQTALELGQQSLKLCQDLSDELGKAFVSQLLGDVLNQLGQSKLAHEKWCQALEIAQSLQHTQLIQALQARLSPDGEGGEKEDRETG